MRRRLTPQPLKWKESFCGSSSWWFASFISGFILHRPWAAASFSAWQDWLIGARVLFGVSVLVETFRVASIRASGKAYRYACSRSSCAAIICCAAAAFSTGRSTVAHTTAAAVEIFRKSRRAIFIVEALLSDLSFDVPHTSCEKPFDLLCYRIHRKCSKVNSLCTFDIKNVNIDKNARCKLAKTPLK